MNSGAEWLLHSCVVFCGHVSTIDCIRQCLNFELLLRQLPFGMSPSCLRCQSNSMVDAIERHAMRVGRWGLGSSAKVKSDILAVMWRTWQVVSWLSVNISCVLIFSLFPLDVINRRVCQVNSIKMPANSVSHETYFLLHRYHILA